MENNVTPNSINDAPLQPFNTADALQTYAMDELKYLCAKHHLIGNFDKNKKYFIIEMIYPELVRINKTIEKQTENQIFATARLANNTINFVVNFDQDEQNNATATLVLEEQICVEKTKLIKLSTTLSSITAENNVLFDQKVRKAFHLWRKDEQPDEKNLFENYVAPPIELVTELLKKSELFEALKASREKFEVEYVNNILKELKNTEIGIKIAKVFLSHLREHKVNNPQANSAHLFHGLLDTLIDEQIEQNAFSNEAIERIAKVRQTFCNATHQEFIIFVQGKTKAAAPIQTKNTPTAKNQPSAKPSAPANKNNSSAPAKSSGGSGSGGGNKSSHNSAKKEESKKEPPKQSSGNFDFLPPQKPQPTQPKVPAINVPQPQSTQPANNNKVERISLDKSIFSAKAVNLEGSSPQTNVQLAVLNSAVTPPRLNSTNIELVYSPNTKIALETIASATEVRGNSATIAQPENTQQTPPELTPEQ